MSAERMDALLRNGEIEILGLLPRASNYTFAVKVGDGDLETIAVYKPRAGETPLWDFPDGTLWARELAAFELSEALGWGFVPPTVAREGPHGIGSLQLFVDADPEEHFFTLLPEHPDVFRRVAAFDLVANNADRKSGHCLLENGTGRIWVVDHGVCFHPEEKLRTVIWDFVAEPIPPEIRSALERLSADDSLEARFASLLDPVEIEAMRARAARLAGDGVFPEPDEGRRHFPWPPV